MSKLFIPVCKRCGTKIPIGLDLHTICVECLVKKKRK
jgi:hypothetical protein